MIKKTTLILLLLLISVAPCALANDGGSRPDHQRLTFSFTLKSNEVKIGETFEFTMKITNNTSREAELLYFWQIFEESHNTQNAKIDGIIIDPYKTTSLDISYQVPENINWYEINGEYFIDFRPELYYLAKEILDGESTDYDWYDIEDDYWDYYQMSTQNIQLKITNLKNGGDFARISILDNKSIVGFNDSAYHESASWNGELLAEHVSYLKIENLSEKTLSKVSVFETAYYPQMENETLQVGENYVFKHTYHLGLLEEDIPQKIDIDFRMIFSLDNQYYCVHTKKQYDTKVYNVPCINIHLIQVDDKNSDTYKYTFLFENNTNETIENFCVLYIEDGKLQSSFEKYGEYTLHGIFNPGDTWHFPLGFPPTEDVHFIAGYMEEGTLYYKSFSPSFSFVDGVGGEKIYSRLYTLRSDLDYEEYIIDVYYLFNDIQITYPTPTSVSTSAAQNASKPLEAVSLATAVSTPSATITPAQSSASVIQIVEADTYYIPKWVWIALITALVIIIGLITCITIKNNKIR